MSFNKQGHFIQGGEWLKRNPQYYDKRASKEGFIKYDDEEAISTPIHEFYKEAEEKVRVRIREHYNIPCNDIDYCLSYLSVIYDLGLADNITPVPLHETANKIATSNFI